MKYSQKKFSTCLMTLALFFSFSCAGRNQNNTTISNVQNQTSQNTNFSISRELAIQNAEKFISSEYDLILYNAVIIDENENTWTIGFAFKTKYKERTGTGGEPTVEVDKKTGNIGRYYFPK